MRQAAARFPATMAPLTGPARPQQRGMGQMVRFTGGGGVVDTVISDHKQVQSVNRLSQSVRQAVQRLAYSPLACLPPCTACRTAWVDV